MTMTKEAVPAVILKGGEKPETVKVDTVVVLSNALGVLSGMAGDANKLVYKDFGEQIENFKAGQLDMSRLRVSDKTHQSIIKTARSVERMIELAKQAQAGDAPKAPAAKK